MTQQQAPLKFPTEFYDAYIFDMDGTIYLGDHLLPGVTRMIEELRRRDIPIRYLSNNPTKDPQLYLEKLERLGLPTDISEIANTVVTMTNWLKEHHPDAVVFPIAEEPLINAFKDAGIKLSDNPEEIDIVVASYDRTFDYRKLQIAFDAIWFHKRAILVATNPDRYCPFPGGRGEPDCASIIAAIEACTQTKCQIVVGKPNPEMLYECLVGLDVDLKHCMMVGDRLGTDIQMAVRAGMVSAMPLTGDSTWQEAVALPEKDQPTYLLDRVDRLIPQSAWEELGWTEDN
ncbi:HAD hydrolase-like protein [Propionimicrobium lymphophilum]|uniref:HAD hydrolase, family IIA n=1 Tax=Propionimicrobium lymphophilum ACS-093-V-SCH5 TaxID=883161 RepID=S2WLQ1_9ACTN|nr:HAD family hydrolase [Propionimicrobium lymphophilum]EPD33602.1 HAD hydrolase, family IIA [Propionimicrobium lymphophilum ACS-093-V-SCH5]MDK7708984.1 HAD hydrolase-like protein [Propionimicrobium lymphophilum]MDK7733068.1 HAD hydrolase-like protein [Propionimicrobium lymphophilum]